MNWLKRVISIHLILGVLLCTVALAQEPRADQAQPGPVTGLVPDHAGASVANIRREAAWYERVLGFKIIDKFGNPNFMVWHMLLSGYAPGYRIDLVQYKGSKRPPPVKTIFLRQGWIHVVFHVQDVAKALKQLQALHVKVTVTYLCAHNVHSAKPCEGGAPIQLLFFDPEHNQLEIRRNVQL
jgi:catechol 2,3-dioxygenase-like lactoylglutathione lyase family enzyme